MRRSVGETSDCLSSLPDMSKVQDDEVGDGTTSVTVLAAELLRVRITSHHRRVPMWSVTVLQQRHGGVRVSP